MTGWYDNSSDNPDPSDRDITVMTSDGQTDSNVAHATIHVVSVNDAPHVTVQLPLYNEATVAA